MNYIIGCGGVGSLLASSFVKLVGPCNVTFVDGDKLEPRNLDRQLFVESQIGHNKAAALAAIYDTRGASEFYYCGIAAHHPRDVLFGLVDNHPARMNILEACDQYHCRAILASNETHSAEALFYQHRWRGTDRDPRIYYPEMTTDHSGDPMARAAGCTGEAQRNNRQLVSANFMAAALAQHLYVCWIMESSKLKPETRETLPYKLVANLTRLETHRKETAV